MYHNWDLTVFYSSFQSVSFQQDWSSLPNELHQYAQWLLNQCRTHDHEIEFLQEYVRRTERLHLKIRHMSSMIHLSSAVNVQDKEARNKMESLHKMLQVLTPSETKLKIWLGRVKNLSMKLENDPFLSPYKYYFEQMQKDEKYLLSSGEEVLLSLLKPTASNAWSRLQGDLLSNLTVTTEENGEVKNLPIALVRNLAFSEKGEERKNGYNLEMKAYKQIDQACAACLNAIKGEYSNLTEKRGYKSPLDRSLTVHRLEKNTLDALLEAVQDSLPAFEKFNLYKAKKLGYENGLPFYDIHAPLPTDSNQNEEVKKYSFDEAKELVLTIFKSFDEELYNMGVRAFRENWIDVEPKVGKRNGAFCSGCPSVKQSRILMNFTGSLDNVFTMAHELGHAFHNEQMFRTSVLLQRAPMPLAETASIFNETLSKHYLLEKATPSEKRQYLLKDLTRSVQVVVDIYSRFLFESSVFNLRQTQLLSVADLCELMKESQQKAYLQGLDHSILHSYMWINKPHYFMPMLHFYNFPYTFGELFGRSLFEEYKKQPASFVPRYKNLLQNCGKGSVEDITSAFGIDVSTRQFWDQSLSRIKENIDWICSE